MPYRLAMAQYETKDKCKSSILHQGWVQGLEPWASRATIWRANQLRHTHRILKKQRNYALLNVPEGIRTPDNRLRRPMLYPAELLAHTSRIKTNDPKLLKRFISKTLT